MRYDFFAINSFKSWSKNSSNYHWVANPSELIMGELWYCYFAFSVQLSHSDYLFPSFLGLLLSLLLFFFWLILMHFIRGLIKRRWFLFFRIWFLIGWVFRFSSALRIPFSFYFFFLVWSIVIMNRWCVWMWTSCWELWLMWWLVIIIEIMIFWRLNYAQWWIAVILFLA